MREPIETDRVRSTFDEVFLESSGLDLSFESAGNYNSEFKHTLLRACTDIAALGGGLRVLEVGVFTGVVSATLARLGYVVSASDVPFVVADPAVDAFLKKENVKAFPVNLATTKFPLPDRSFDVIIFHSVLTHLNVNPIPILQEFHRLLDKDGVVYCNTPNLLAAKNRWQILSGKGYLDTIDRLAWNLDPGTGMSVGLHWREWTKGELIELFDHCGFDTENHRFVLTTPNRSGFPRKTLVSLMYALCPSLMTTQIGLFKKRGGEI